MTVYLAAMLALGNELTVGMIFAFMGYKLNFTEKAVQLVEKVLDFRLLDLHLERISDIALSPLEPGHDRPLAIRAPLARRDRTAERLLPLRRDRAFVLENVNLKVEAGQVRHHHGPFGRRQDDAAEDHARPARADERRGLIDGIPLPTIGARAYREQVGAVMQEDQLLSGSIADNICFFDPSFDQERMMVRPAGGHPRRDHGDADGLQQPDRRHGQLALRRPEAAGAAGARPLQETEDPVPDEGTAHLDVENERQINEASRGSA